MEFPAGGSDFRSSSYLSSSSGHGYFTEQALRAGYLGNDFRRSELVPYSIASAEALKRELEKKQIREEIIAKEMARKRELEEEVRRELAMEREIALRRRYAFAASSLQSESGIVLPPRLSEGRVEEILPVPVGRYDIGAFESLPVAYRREPVPEPAQKGPVIWEKEIEPVPEVGKRKIVFLSKAAQSPTLTGLKRKVTSANTGDEETWPVSLKKTRNEWSCALCQVSATNKEGLNAHLQGKKHKAKEEELGVGSTQGKTIGNFSSVAKKKTDEVMVKMKDGAVKTDEVMVKKKDGAVAKKTDEVMVKKKDGANIIKPKTQHQKPKGQKQHTSEKRKGLYFWCNLCQVKCTNESIKVAHLGGKKHLAKLQEKEEAAKAGGMKVDGALMIKETKIDLKRNIVGNEDGITKVLESSKELVASEAASDKPKKADTAMPNKKANKVMTKISKKQRAKQQMYIKKKYFKFRCDLCDVSCTSESMKAAHLRGKKHTARLQEELEEGVGKAAAALVPIDESVGERWGNTDDNVDGVAKVEKSGATLVGTKTELPSDEPTAVANLLSKGEAEDSEAPINVEMKTGYSDNEEPEESEEAIVEIEEKTLDSDADEPEDPSAPIDEVQEKAESSDYEEIERAGGDK